MGDLVVAIVGSSADAARVAAEMTTYMNYQPDSKRVGIVESGKLKNSVTEARRNDGPTVLIVIGTKTELDPVLSKLGVTTNSLYVATTTAKTVGKETLLLKEMLDAQPNALAATLLAGSQIRTRLDEKKPQVNPRIPRGGTFPDENPFSRGGGGRY